jgi:hypothetical protein
VVAALRNAALDVLLVNDPPARSNELELALGRTSVVPEIGWCEPGKRKAQWKEETRRYRQRP